MSAFTDNRLRDKMCQVRSRCAIIKTKLRVTSSYPHIQDDGMVAMCQACLLPDKILSNLCHNKSCSPTLILLDCVQSQHHEDLLCLDIDELVDVCG